VAHDAAAEPARALVALAQHLRLLRDGLQARVVEVAQLEARAAALGQLLELMHRLEHRLLALVRRLAARRRLHGARLPPAGQKPACQKSGTRLTYATNTGHDALCGAALRQLVVPQLDGATQLGVWTALYSPLEAAGHGTMQP